MLSNLIRFSPFLVLLLLVAYFGLNYLRSPKVLDLQEFEALYQTPPPRLTLPVNAFHLGHSLVGRTMPAMLAQLAAPTHSYDSQLGWGSSLHAHWDPKVTIKGFETENDRPRYRDAHDAVSSGDYNVLVLTESVEIRDAIRYHDSGKYLYLWAEKAMQANPDTRVYLYETWHGLDDPEGWLERIDLDLERYWEGEILRQALAKLDSNLPIYVIPAGQVMAAFSRELKLRGGIGNMLTHQDLFKLNADGTQDQIHPSDFGNYLVALTHYAVIYQRSPIGLPHRLLRADGTPADDPGPEAARLMQEITWQVVQEYSPTGVQPSPAASQ